MKKLWHGKRLLNIIVMIAMNISIFMLTNATVEAFDLQTSEVNISGDEDLYDKILLLSKEEMGNIECFSVNSDGEIAVGVSNNINIYDAEGNYQYGYHLPVSGAYIIELDSEVMSIYLHRKQSYIQIDETGEVQKAFKVTDTLNNQKVVNKLMSDRKNKVSVNDTKYFIKNNKLIKEDLKEDQIIIFDGSNHASFKGIIFVDFMLVVITTVIIYFVKMKKK